QVQCDVPVCIHSLGVCTFFAFHRTSGVDGELCMVGAIESLNFGKPVSRSPFPVHFGVVGTGFRIKSREPGFVQCVQFRLNAQAELQLLVFTCADTAQHIVQCLRFGVVQHHCPLIHIINVVGDFVAICFRH